MSLLSLLPGGDLFDELPETDPQECAIAMADGRWWDASFLCPGMTFVRGLVSGPDDEDDDEEEQ